MNLRYYTQLTVSSILLPVDKKSAQNIEFKGLTGKIFRNKDLAPNFCFGAPFWEDDARPVAIP